MYSEYTVYCLLHILANVVGHLGVPFINSHAVNMSKVLCYSELTHRLTELCMCELLKQILYI